MSEMLRVGVLGGAFTVIQESDGRLHALWYGKPWRDLTGDNLVLGLASNLERERDRLTNTEILMFVAGWQGGTVGQLAEALQTTVKDILEAGHDRMAELCRAAQQYRNSQPR